MKFKKGVIYRIEKWQQNIIRMQIYDDKNSNIKEIKLGWYKERIFRYIIYIKKEKRNRGYYIIDERKLKKGDY